MQELIKVQIENKDGINVVSSRIIAEQLGKRHSDVLVQIEKLLTDESVRSLIIPSEYKDKKGEMRKEYLLTKDGFTLYMFNVQGYNDFKMAYINRFNEMEKALQVSQKDRYLLQLFSNDALQVATAHKALLELETKPLIKKIEQDKPLVNYAMQVSQSDNSISIGLFAKTLADNNIKIGQNRLFKWLRDNGYIDNKNIPKQVYIERGYFEVVPQTYTNQYGKQLTTKTLVTGKGQIYFANKLRKVKKC